MKKITLFSIFLFSIFYVNSQPNVRESEQLVIQSFTFVNATNDLDLLEIENGAVYSTDQISSNLLLNIRANEVKETFGSVTFSLSGNLIKQEIDSKAPFAIYNEKRGDYDGVVFGPGTYNLTATPYSGNMANGKMGETLSISFTIVDLKSFKTTWKTDNPGVSANNQITIPTYPGGIYNYTVNWGDGSSDNGVTGNITHTYAIPGVYQVAITGDFPRIYSNREGDNEKIISVDQWGTIRWGSMENAFFGCYNLDVTAIDLPDLSLVNSLSNMFSQCNSLIFNDSINSWDVSNVEVMSRTFGDSTFNKDIGGWDVSKVREMTYMFAGNRNFNQNIGGWNVNNVNTMAGMFLFATSFNHNIGGWNVSGVTDMNYMFGSASSFNQEIGNWEVAGVANMSRMFWFATSFNQNLSNWNVANVSQMTDMFSGAGLSNNNYDATLIGWNNLPSLQPNVTFDAGNSQYCTAENARQYIINTYGWTINDGGLSIDCVVTSSKAASIDKSYTINLYPNSAKESVILSVTNSNIVIKEIFIYDLAGRMIKQFNASQVQGLDGYKLPLSSLNSGSYIVSSITKDGTTFQNRLLVNK